MAERHAAGHRVELADTAHDLGLHPDCFHLPQAERRLHKVYERGNDVGRQTVLCVALPVSSDT